MKTLLIIIGVLISVVSANEENHHHHHHHHHHKKCRGEPIVRNEEFDKSKHECRKEIPIHENEEEAEGKKIGRSCRAVCAMTKVGAFDDKGFIVESKLTEMINAAIVNQEARKEINEGVLECGRNATGLGTALSDNKCSNYNSYFQCTWLTIVEACTDPFAHEEELE